MESNTMEDTKDRSSQEAVPTGATMFGGDVKESRGEEEFDAVRRNALTKDSTEEETELLITRCLWLASDRDGGRSQRANRQTT
ncbi:unnamed protein product [Leuciscus chuanchicus]